MAKKTKKTKRAPRVRPTDEMRREALARAEDGSSERNYDAIFAGFSAMGIDEDDILPRENVLTYNAWIAKGRQVKKGSHGVKVETFIVMKKTDESAPKGEQDKVFRRPKITTVFHISQTLDIKTGAEYVKPSDEDEEDDGE